MCYKICYKKYCLVLGCFFCCGMITYLHAEPGSVFNFVLNTHVPKSSKIDGLTAFYHGVPYDLSKATNVIAEQKKRVVFSVVIGEEFLPHVQGNLIVGLKRIANKPVRWYDLTLELSHTDEQEPVYVWRIEELVYDEQTQKDARPIVLPDHAIVIQAHPDIIQEVKQTHQNSVADQLLMLPTICIKENVHMDSNNLYATMASIDLRSFHGPIEQCKTCIPHACALQQVKVRS
jgi:hypothetical protein